MNRFSLALGEDPEESEATVCRGLMPPDQIPEMVLEPAPPTTPIERGMAQYWRLRIVQPGFETLTVAVTEVHVSQGEYGRYFFELKGESLTPDIFRVC